MSGTNKMGEIIDKCMIPRLAKKGEKLWLGGVEYRVVKCVAVEGSALFEVTLEAAKDEAAE